MPRPTQDHIDLHTGMDKEVWSRFVGGKKFDLLDPSDQAAVVAALALSVAVAAAGFAVTYNLAMMGKDAHDGNGGMAMIDGLAALASAGGLLPLDDLPGILALIGSVEATGFDAACSTLGSCDKSSGSDGSSGGGGGGAESSAY